MEKMNFSKYLWEMWDIAKENKMDVGVGRDMFWANLNNHGDEDAPHYAGADQLDYAQMSAKWKAMTQEEQWEQKIVCGYVSRSKYGSLVKARRAGDRETWEEIVAAGVEEYFTVEAAPEQIEETEDNE